MGGLAQGGRVGFQEGTPDPWFTTTKTKRANG